VQRKIREKRAVFSIFSGHFVGPRRSLLTAPGGDLDASPDSAARRGTGRRILRNGSWLLAPKTVGAILSILYLAIIARTLGPGDFGIFALIFSFAQTVAGIAAFQSWQIIIRYGTKPAIYGDKQELAALTSLCIALDLAAVAIGLAIAIAAVALLAQRFGWDGSMQHTVLAITVLLILSSRSTPNGLLRVHDDFRITALVDSLVPVIRFAGVLIVYAIGPDIVRFLVVWSVSEFVPTLLVWALVLRKLRLPLGAMLLRSPRAHWRRFPDFGRYALWSSVNSTLRFSSQHIMVVVVGFFTGPAAAGFFRLGHQLGQVVARIADGLSLAFFMEYARATHHDGDHARSMVARVMRVTLVSAATMVAFLFIVGKPALALVFGADYLPAFPYVMLLGAAAAVQVSALAFEPVLLSHGRARDAMLANLVGTLALFGLLLVLMPWLGTIGAGVAVLAGAIVGALMLGVFFRRLQRQPGA